MCNRDDCAIFSIVRLKINEKKSSEGHRLRRLHPVLDQYMCVCLHAVTVGASSAVPLPMGAIFLKRRAVGVQLTFFTSTNSLIRLVS